MAKLPADRKINVTLPVGLQGDVNWAEEPDGTFVCEHLGVVVYNDSNLLVARPTDFYVYADDLEEVIFRDMYVGATLVKDFGLSFDMTSGFRTAALSYVNAHGTRGMCTVLCELREAIINGIRFKLFEDFSQDDNGYLYPIGGYYLQLDGSKLFIVDGQDRREFK